MDKRKIAKHAAELVAAAVAKKYLTKGVNLAIPASEDHETVTDIATGVAAFAIVDHFKPQLHAATDKLIDTIQSKTKKNPTTQK